MSSISRIPAGIIGFLGIKNGGRYPQELSPTLLPTWDVSNLYLEYSAEYVQTVATLNAGGYLALHTAPIGEVWWVTHYAIDIATGAGESWRGCLSRANPTGTIFPSIGVPETLGANGWTTLIPQNVPQILQPGESLGVATDSVTGPVDYVSRLRFVRLQM